MIARSELLETGEAAPSTRTLSELETVIARNRQAVIETGEALREIRDLYLYWDAGYLDFSSYVKGRWGMSPAWARALIDFATLRAEGVEVQTPTQARAVVSEWRRDPAGARRLFKEAADKGWSAADAARAVKYGLGVRRTTSLARKLAELDMTQDELARRSGVCRETINKLAGGKMLTRASHIAALAWALACPVVELADLTDQWLPEGPRPETVRSDSP